ncbi:PREDICTED: platelet glycoprotein Ib alpha chain-like [Papilio polytes]|uniref:platelet glycoprotein Ib alpha chain-like n=1 Tax=Papilio polytes TaxID=76194 RepID=UPI000675EAAA|nr:PREDICTED: platelet glycoprotein Ib alpha chain-like [Papilio polytes]
MLFVLVLFVCAWNAVYCQDVNTMMNMPKYDARYDYLDVDALFNSKRLVRNYVDCLINSQRCTPEGKALKRLLPEALRTKCVRCTERQKRTAVKIIKRLKTEYPEEWAKLATKWDPTGDFTRYFEVFLANEQFNTITGNTNDNPSSPSPQPPPQPNVLSVLPATPSTSRAVPLTNPTTLPLPTSATPPRPLLLNRFSDDGELMMSSPSSAVATPRPTAPPIISRSPTTMRTRPTPVDWSAVGYDSKPTMFTLRPVDNNEAYTTAITFIDQIGNKIIRTTEFVADILKNTVRAVVG